MHKILVVDDDASIAKLLKISFEASGYKTLIAHSCEDALIKAATEPCEAVILDLSLPQKDGFEFIARFREYSNAPILVLSAKSDEASKIKALNLGADDFIDKPFSVPELVARLSANLRRISNPKTSRLLSCGDIEIDFLAHTVTIRGEELKCTPKEFELLALFVKNTGKTLTHHWLLKEVWGVGYQNETQYLRVFIKQLRQKIELEPSRPKIIITEAGIGYKMRCNGD